MENGGGQNGVRSNHGIDFKVHGFNGSSSAAAHPSPSHKEKDSAAYKDEANTITNGGEVGGAGADMPLQQVSQPALPTTDQPSRMNDLPDEIQHITQGFIPISLLLTRLAQTTHNSLQDKVAELAKMPLPAAAVNGNANHSATAPDDASNENLRKKALLLNYVQDTHAKWVKALVITEWSRKSQMVSKLIDLKFHIDQQRILYDVALDSIVNVKRDLTFARMPSPDMKTALQVLSTGSAPWIPDLQYIEPPPLTSDDQLKWMDDLDTLLSLRLNLDDYDKVPQQFKEYQISSGRVTFKVAGEFEVDLTIADEDFEKQFWFIDFRYAFSPSAESLPESLMTYLEGCVNDTLGKDGLEGCYKFLHEFVLTSKINELRRQASQLSRTSWTGTLTVEPLNRALAIQYWTSRTATTGTKNWILLGVESGRKTKGPGRSKASSCIVVKWFRDNKEVKDVDIPFDVEKLSAESLLRTIVGKHVEYTLTSIHDKLLAAPRFNNREAGMVLHISRTDAGASNLATQVGYNDKATVSMEPTTGVFAVKPHSKFTIQYEHQLNNGKTPAEDGVTCLENVRCGIMEDEINRRGSSMGWSTRRSPITNEELKSVTKLRDWTRTLWLQKNGWGSNWFVMVFMGLGGDEWWLLETNRGRTSRGLGFQTKLPLNKGHPNLSDGFWNNLALFATGMIAQSVDTRELHRHRIKSRPSGGMNLSLPQQIRVPSIELALSAIFPAMVFGPVEKNGGKMSPEQTYTIDNIELLSTMQESSEALSLSRQPWANNIVTIKFKGVESTLRPREAEDAQPGTDHHLTCISDAIIKVKDPTKFTALKGMVDRDVSYDPQRGEFSLRMRHALGELMLPTLKSQIKAIDRFVNFLESVDKVKGAAISESVSLREVAFYYGQGHGEETAGEEDGPPSGQWRVVLDLSKEEISIGLEKDNPHIRVADVMTNLVNSDGGIGALMAWLPSSLAAVKAIDAIDKKWTELRPAGQAQLEFSMETIAYINLRYFILGLDNCDPRYTKPVSLEVKVKPRRGEAWWHIRRSDPGATETPEDEYAKALKSVWEGKGDNWLGLTTGAAGKPNGGVMDMLLAVDEAMQTALSAQREVAVEAGPATKQKPNSDSQSRPPAAKPSNGTAKGKTNAKGNAKGAGKNNNSKGKGDAQVVVLD